MGRRLFGFGVSLAMCFGLSCAPATQAPETPDAPTAPQLFSGLGDQHHPITTTSETAQAYFDQGLILVFGFNHEAAIRSFEAALVEDPGCAMCAWGIALALGPNINAPMGPDAERQAFLAAQRAQQLAAGVSDRERAYIEAIQPRYGAEPLEDRSPRDRAFADAMGKLHEADPADTDAATLYAEALMDLTPWNYWTDEAEPREHTEEVLDLLEGVLAVQPDHVGANHYYIHAVEEHFPERGVPAAERLGGLAPEAGHLVHMPSHIFWRVGRYDEATELNRKAAAADEAFFATCRAGVFYRALYYPHNIHFLWAAAAAQGQSQVALTNARKLETRTADQMAQFDFLEEFSTVPMLTLARFGRWDEVLGVPRPDASLVYLTGVWHYTRGLAQVRLGRPDMARSELEQLVAAAQSERAAGLIVSGGVASVAALLEVGRAHLAGELAAAGKDYDSAIAQLTAAVDAQDALAYMEPPPWYFPTRQALGAVLLDADRAAEAEAVYRVDLEQYPRNGWSLFGLAQSLRAQGKTAEAEWAEKGHREAFAKADVTLRASRF
ncbi:MAG: hypothetical protein AAF430_15000 [Myxococcota bacterium]